MKNIYLLYILLGSLTLWSCKKDGEALDYKGFSIEVASDYLNADRGETVVIKGHVICQSGIKDISVKVGKWDELDTEKNDVIEVTGQPKTYDFEYVVTIPDEASVDQCSIDVSILDYKGDTIEQTYTISIKEDNEKPTLSIISPAQNQQLSPADPLKIEVIARDNLIIDKLYVTCEELGINKLYSRGGDKTAISVNEEFDITTANGEYTILFKALDLQGNEVEERKTIQILVASKPDIRRLDQSSGYVSVGASAAFQLRISTNILRTITNIKIESQLLGINETLTPNEVSYDLIRTYAIPSDFGKQTNVPILITATNDLNETSDLTLYYNTIERLYIIGTAVMSNQKESQALEMAKNSTDKNIFEIITWVDAPNDWFKFISERSWNGDLNLGLDEEGKKVINGGKSEYIRITERGYHKIKFDISTWNYTVEPYVAPSAAEYSSIYVSGQDFEYKNANGIWTAVTSWDTMIPLKKHPNTPHRFYLDILCHKSCIGFSAQDNKDDGGIFFGIEGDPGWKWVWWEHVSPLITKNKDSDITKIKEDGRENNVMRIIIDTHLNMISWIEKQEYTYPAE